MADDRQEVKIMQFLGLDYSKAIEEAEKLNKALKELDKSLDEVEKGKGSKGGGGILSGEKKAVEETVTAMKSRTKETETYYAYLKSVKLIEEARAKANNQSLVEEAQNQKIVLQDLVKRREQLEEIYQVEAQIQRERLIRKNPNLSEAGINKAVSENEKILDIKAKIAEVEKDTVSTMREQSVLTARIKKDAEVRKTQEAELNDQLEISRTKASISESRRLMQSAKISGDTKLISGELKNQVNTLEEILQKNGKLTADESSRLRNLQKQTKILRERVNSEISDKTADGNLIGEEFKRRVGWFISGSIWSEMVSQGKEFIRDMKEIEEGMMEISRVMQDATYNSDKFRDSLMEIGHTYGYTFQDMQPIATRWAQSGYDAADTLELTKNSLLALNVAELDAKQSTEGLIAIMQQWGLEAKQSEMLIDKINKTADSFPVTSQDVVDGLQKMGATAKNANMSLDETIAVLVAMKSASGATGKEVGNAAKSILSYVQRAASIDTFESLGIDVFTDKTKTQFKSIMDIFDQISDKWKDASNEIKDGFVKAAEEAGVYNEEVAKSAGLTKEFNDINRRDISQAAAGVFRRNYFISLIENMRQTKDVMEELRDVEGYSRRENENAMETQAKRIEQVKNSFQQLKLTFADSGIQEMFKVLISGGDDVLKILNKIPPEVVKIGTQFAMVSASVKGLESLKKLEGVKSLLNATGKDINILGFKDEIGAVKTAIDAFKVSASGGGGAVKNLGAAFSAATTSAEGFQIGLGSITFAIMAGVTAYKLISKAIKDYKERYDNLLKTQEDSMLKLEDEETSLRKLKRTREEMVELNQKIYKGEGNASDKTRLLEIQRELVDTYGMTPEKIDDEGNAYVQNTQKVLDYISAKEQALEVSKKEANDEFDNNQYDIKEGYEKAIEDSKAYAESLKKTQKSILELRKKISEQEKGGLWSKLKLSGTKEALEKLIDYQKHAQEEYKRSIDFINKAEQLGRKQALRILDDYVNEAKKKSKEYSEAEIQAYRDIIANAKFAGKSRIEIEKQVKDIMERTAENSGGLKELQKALEGTGISYDGVNLSMEQNVKAMKDAQAETDTLVGAVRNVDDQLIVSMSSMGSLEREVSNLSREYDELTDIQKDLKNGNMLTEESLNRLCQVFPELKDKTDLSSEAVSAFLNEMLATREGYIRAQLDMTTTANLNTNDRILSLKEEMKAWAQFLANINEAREQADYIARNARAVRNENIGRGRDFSEEPTANDFAKYGALKKSTELKLKRSVSEIKALTSETSASASKSIQAVIDKLNKGIATSNKAGRSARRSGGAAKRASADRASAQKQENAALKEALELIDRRAKLEKETYLTAKRDLVALRDIKARLAKTDDEKFDLDVRIMEMEKKYFSLRLENSKRWIEEQKKLRIFNLEDEIAAWERIKKGQGDYIEAATEAEEKLYELRKSLREKNIKDEETYIGRLKRVNLLSNEDEISMYESLYSKFNAESESEKFDRIENLYGLYHKRIDDIFKDIDDNHNKAIKSMTDSIKNSPLADNLKNLDSQLKTLKYKKAEQDNLKKMEDTIKKLRELREEAQALGMDTEGLFGSLPQEYLSMLDGALTEDEKLTRMHKARIKNIEEEGKALSALKQKEIDDINRQIEALEKLEEKERKDKELAKLKEELEYYKVRTSEDARKKVKELEEKINEFLVDDSRKSEKEKLKDKADKLKKEKDLIDDDYKNKKKRLEDEFNLEKKIRDEIASIRKDGKEYSIELEIERLTDYKSKLEEEKRLQEERMQEEVKKKEEQYELLKSKFTDHMKNVIALSASLSKDAFDEWQRNYIIPMKNALERGDYGEAMGYMARSESYVEKKSSENRDYYSRESINQRSNNRLIYELASRIVELKRDWEMYHEQGNRTGMNRVNSEANKLRARLSQYDARLANLLLNSGLKESERILAGLPKYHTGGEVLKDGIAALKKNEIVLPPNLSVEFKALRDLIIKNPPSKVTNDNRSENVKRIINIDSILKTDDVRFNDRREKEDVIKEITNVLRSL